MTETLNFREFYQKTPILISPKDGLAIQKEGKYTEIFNHYTHWLIALEGREMDQKTFQWRVVIFPSRASGQFNYKCPFFKSPFLHLFNDALDLSKRMETLAKQDQLMTIHK